MNLPESGNEFADMFDRFLRREPVIRKTAFLREIVFDRLLQQISGGINDTFTILYLRKFGFQVSNEPFKQYSWYFRNALVRANYNNYAHGISSTTIYLERFFENLIFQGKNELKNRFCHILWKEGQSAQSAIPKCHRGTLEKVALDFLRENPKATQKMLSEHIGKSERTAKRLTKALQEKGLLVRKNGKRNGVWEVKPEKLTQAIEKVPRFFLSSHENTLSVRFTLAV